MWTTAVLIVIGLVLVGCANTITPASTPAPTAPPVATARPTAEPTEYVGSGVITFGKSYNTNTLKIIGPAASFKTSSTLIAWSGELSEAAGATTLTFIIATQNAAGAEGIVRKEQTDVSDPAADMVAAKDDLAGLVGRKVGTYVMRYLRGGTILAEGTFRLVK